MQQLGAGVQTIEGVTVFPDHADPGQFWYLPAPVALARRAADGRADLTFIKYKPAAVEAGVKGGGFLLFTTALALEPEVEQRIRSQLPRPPEGELRLAAVPFDEGTVQCVALDLQGSGGTVAEAAAPGTFNAVETILGATIPSLAGDNTALFSLTLSQEGATILEQALEEGMTPVGVVYNLRFTALRPALDVKITADFERIYDHFSVGLKATVYFIEADLSAAFEELVQNGAIKIEVTNFSTEADRSEKEKWALDFFKEKLLSDWFTPTLSPGVVQGQPGQPGQPSTAGRPTSPATQPGATPGRPAGRPGGPPPPAPPPPGGVRPPPGASRPPAPPPAGRPGAPRVPAPPGAPPAGAPAGPGAPAVPGGPAVPGAPAVPAVPAVPGAPTTSATPPAGVPPTPPVAGAPRVPPVPGTPAAPGGARPTTPGAPGTPGQPAPHQADAGTPKVSFHLKYIEQEERKTLTFEYHSSEATQRTYAPQAFFGLLAEDLDRDDYFLEVDLDDPFFRTFKVDVDIPVDFAKIGLHSATVALDYGDPADPESHKHEDLVFNAATPGPQVFEVFVNDRYDLAYRHRVELNFDPESGWDGEHNSYALPEETTEDRTLLVDPHASLGFVEVDVFPHRLDAGVISWTDVHLTYEDPASGWKAERTLTINPGGEHQAWRVRTSSPDHKSYSYRLVHHLKDGTTREAEPVTSRASSLPIDDPFPASIDPQFVFQFPPADFQRVLIDLTYEDSDNSYSREEQLELVGPAIQPTAMHIATLDPKKRAFRYRVTLVGQDGKIVRGPELESELELVGVGPSGEQV